MEDNFLDNPADTLVNFGSEIKVLSETADAVKVGGWAVVFDSHDASRLRDKFLKTTDFDIENGETRSLYYNHGLDGTIKKTRLGRATLELKDAGVWYSGEIAKRKDYLKAHAAKIIEGVKAGLFGTSTGAPAHMVERKAIDGGHEVTLWPISEISITPTPAEPLTSCVSLKSLMESDEYSDEIKKFNPDQPRDDDGKFATGGTHTVGAKVMRKSGESTQVGIIERIHDNGRATVRWEDASNRLTGDFDRRSTLQLDSITPVDGEAANAIRATRQNRKADLRTKMIHAPSEAEAQAWADSEKGRGRVVKVRPNDYYGVARWTVESLHPSRAARKSADEFDDEPMVFEVMAMDELSGSEASVKSLADWLCASDDDALKAIGGVVMASSPSAITDLSYLTGEMARNALENLGNRVLWMVTDVLNPTCRDFRPDGEPRELTADEKNERVREILSEFTKITQQFLSALIQSTSTKSIDELHAGLRDGLALPEYSAKVRDAAADAVKHIEDFAVIRCAKRRWSADNHQALMEMADGLSAAASNIKSLADEHQPRAVADEVALMDAELNLARLNLQLITV